MLDATLVAIMEITWSENLKLEVFSPTDLMVPYTRDVHPPGEEYYNQKDVSIEFHNVLETPDRGTSAFHQAGQVATTTSTALLQSVIYGSFPTRTAGDVNPILRTVQVTDLNTSFVQSAQSRPRATSITSLNHRGPNRSVPALEWSAEMITRYCVYRRAHHQVQIFRGLFHSPVSRLVTEQFAHLETSMALVDVMAAATAAPTATASKAVPTQMVPSGSLTLLRLSDLVTRPIPSTFPVSHHLQSSASHASPDGSPFSVLSPVVLVFHQ